MRIRFAVFVEEQGCPSDVEQDAVDVLAEQFIAIKRGTIVGTARAYLDGSAGWIGRVAVLSEHRRTGIGARLMRAAEEWIREQGATVIYLKAQVEVISFYERLGYSVGGAEFMEAGIRHRRMNRRLARE